MVHTAGWPLDAGTYGGSFLYHLENNQVAVGFVVGLGYENPYLNPYEEFQRYKTHPAIRGFFEGGKRVAYGARAITAGGLQSLPKLVFPGGCLIGDDAGFLNASRIKGSHAAIKTGMLAAEAAFDALGAGPRARRARRLSGGVPAVVAVRRAVPRAQLQALDGQGPGHRLADVRHRPDGVRRQAAVDAAAQARRQRDAAERRPRRAPIAYPKPDGVLTFDRLTSVSFSNTNHNEDQPIHLTLKDPAVPITINLERYDAPEQRYCPAGVYEIVRNDDGSDPRLQINAQNCVHCKTCDIKDPTQNIVWVAPEGGGGPNYPNM